MPATHAINVDLARVYTKLKKQGEDTEDKRKLLTTLSWGDAVEVLNVAQDHVEIRLTFFDELPDGSQKPRQMSGFIQPSRGVKTSEVVVPLAESRVLKVAFVDVQQGDGAVIESPGGKVVLIDGGDNQLFARYLAGRFRGTTADAPKEVDCILVSHGDADHFQGLTRIHQSETHDESFKRIFIHPARVYHNGLVKRPDSKGGRKRKEVEMLGATQVVDGTTIITGLEEDLLAVPDAEMNEPFLAWKRALEAFSARGPIEFRRLQKGDDDAFDFLAHEDVKVEVLGPIPTKAGQVRGLKFLGTPPKGPRLGHEALSLEEDESSKPSASHTINGHSVILRIAYGAFRFLFSGDLNDEAGRALTRAHKRGDLDLTAEVFKVPHHGSADFSAAFLEAVSPVISIVSSGDESARKEYIHPRATLMGALGKFSRVEEPLVFVTELVAFFEMQGYIRPEFHSLDDAGVCKIEGGIAVVDKKAAARFFAFKRTAFGIVKVHTDGKRLLVYTNSGQAKLKEAYAYEAGKRGKPPVPVDVRMA